MPKTLPNRGELLKIAKDWERQGIAILATCLNSECKNKPLVPNSDKTGYICPNCLREWFWGGKK